MATFTGYTAGKDSKEIKDHGKAIDIDAAFPKVWTVCTCGKDKECCETDFLTPDEKKPAENKIHIKVSELCVKTDTKNPCKCQIFIHYDKAPKEKEDDKDWKITNLSHWISAGDVSEALLIAGAHHTVQCVRKK